MTLMEAPESAARKLIRTKLDTYLQKVPDYGVEVRSGTPVIPKSKMNIMNVSDAVFFADTDPIFFKYTQRRHGDLLFEWYHNSDLTTCNDFCCHAGYAMGANFNVGVFEIATVLKSKGRADAWVPAGGTARPKYGDIFRSKSYHMGVSLGCYGGGWWTVESGQGGPSQGYDALKRKIGFYKPGSLRGWVDMEKLIVGSAVVPEWLVGWWIIYEGAAPYYYHFSVDFKVSYAPMQPQPGAPVGFSAVETVPFSMTAPDTVAITWDGGTVESLSRAPDTIPGVLEKLVGTTRPPTGGVNALKGVQL